MLNPKRQPSPHKKNPGKGYPGPRNREGGVTLVEVMIAGVLLALLLLVFARFDQSSARAQNNLNTATLAADVGELLSTELARGNPLVTGTLSTNSLNALQQAGHRARLTPGTTATVTAQGGDPPTYRIHVLVPGTSPYIFTAVGAGGTE